MTQQHEEDTRVERLGPSEMYADESPATSTRDEVVPSHRRSTSGATFYGWLVAIGMIALLTGIIGAIATAVDYALTINWNAAKGSASTAGTVGIVSVVVLLLVLAIAYYSGGSVAARLARAHGGLHGFGVWLLGIVVTAIVAGLAALAGSEYDVLNRVDLPSLPIADNTLTTGGLVAVAAAVVITLIAAVAGGLSGQRRID
ncbi:hypothetical protein GCM10009630_58080 [Kribbella jejuensis]|jgi:hypothetical protein|uniref:Uncharacterized protein n=1 Tax=Kribbella jejuensis TaxID=236068 RepID=A0A542ENC3_9ACTN|nr:hypothetical protein [Kribbella jejuensis]TQJ16850.1 hypothetical protein FB475_0956 [Kribbella jejuensis]